MWGVRRDLSQSRRHSRRCRIWAAEIAERPRQKTPPESRNSQFDWKVSRWHNRHKAYSQTQSKTCKWCWALQNTSESLAGRLTFRILRTHPHRWISEGHASARRVLSKHRNEKQTMPQFCSSSPQARKFLHLYDVIDDSKQLANLKEKATNHRSRYPAAATAGLLRAR